MSDSIRLHFHPVSPSSRAVLAGLHHLGSTADVEFVEVDIRAGESQLPSYRALNPNGMIPCLEVGDFRLWESGAILQYLADRYGPSELYPTALEARANVNRWIQWNLAHFGKHIRTLAFERMWKPMLSLGPVNALAEEESAKQFARFLSVLNRQLGSGAFVAGDAPTIADFHLYGALTYREGAKLGFAAGEHVQRWLERMSALPAIQALPAV